MREALNYLHLHFSNLWSLLNRMSIFYSIQCCRLLYFGVKIPQIYILCFRGKKPNWQKSFWSHIVFQINGPFENEKKKKMNRLREVLRFFWTLKGGQSWQHWHWFKIPNWYLGRTHLTWQSVIEILWQFYCEKGRLWSFT